MRLYTSSTLYCSLNVQLCGFELTCVVHEYRIQLLSYDDNIILNYRWLHPLILQRYSWGFVIPMAYAILHIVGILSALRPLLFNSTWPRHTLQRCSLTTVAQRQTISWETINHAGTDAATTRGAVPYSNHIQPPQPGSAPRVSYESLRDKKQWVPCAWEFQANQFSREHWNWRYSNSQPLAPKACAVISVLSLYVRRNLHSGSLNYGHIYGPDFNESQ